MNQVTKTTSVMIQQRKMSSQKAINGKERGGETGVSGFIVKRIRVMLKEEVR